MKAKLNFKSKRTIIIASIIAVLAVGAGLGGYFYAKGNNQAGAANLPNESTQTATDTPNVPTPNTDNNGATTPDTTPDTNTGDNNDGTNNGDGANTGDATNPNNNDNANGGNAGNAGDGTANNGAAGNNAANGNANAGNAGDANAGDDTDATTVIETVTDLNPWESHAVAWTPETLNVSTPSVDVETFANIVGEKSNSIEANEEGKKVVKPADTFTYTIKLTNYGNITGTTTVTDEVPSGLKVLKTSPEAEVDEENENKLTWKDISLKSGESKDITITVEVLKNVEGQLENFAIVGEEPTNTDTTDTLNYDVKKEVISTDANADGKYDIYEVIEYKVLVTNTGSVTGTKVKVTDPNADKEDGKIATRIIDVIEPGMTEEVTFKHTVTEADIKEGKVVNVATAEGKDSDEVITETEKQNPDMKVEKTATKVGETEITDENINDLKVKAKDVITYTIKVENIGNVTLEDIEVSDDNEVYGIDEDGNKVAYDKNEKGDYVIATGVKLIPGESKEYNVKYLVTQDDVDNNQSILNVATAKTEEVERKDDDNTVITNQKSDYKVEKKATKVNGVKITADTKVKAKDVITYTIKVENTGYVTLKDLEVTDNNEVYGIDENGEKITYSKNNDGVYVIATGVELAPGESEEYTAYYEVTQSDVDNKEKIANTATVGDKNSTDETVPTNKKSDYKVEKKATKVNGVKITADTKVKAKDVITYTIKVENTGYVTLKDLEVTDNNEVYRIDENGEKVTYSKNNDGVYVIATGVELAPGEHKEYTVHYEVTQSDVDNKEKIANTATVGDKNSTDETVPTNKKSDYKVEKKATKVNGVKITSDTKVKAKDVITYTINVENTGYVTLKDLEVTDNNEVYGLDENGEKVTYSKNNEGVYVIATGIELAPGESKEYTVYYEVTQSDVDNKEKIANTATVGDKESTDETVPTNKKSDYTVEKKATKVNGEDITSDTKVKAKDVITYTIKVENTGYVTLKDLEVTDNNEVYGIDENGEKVTYSKNNAGVYVIETGVELAPGESKEYTVYYEVTQSDVDNKEKIANTATVGDKNSTDETVPTNKETKVALKKLVEGKNESVNLQAVKEGDVLVYSVELTNKGNTTITSAVITDEMLGITNKKFEFAAVAPGEKTTIKLGEYTVSKEDIASKTTIKNVVTAENGEEPSEIETPVSTEITLVKEWDDNNNADGVRPENITVQLKANGENYKEPVVLTAKNKNDDIDLNGNTVWSYTWTGLPKTIKNEQGEFVKVTYTVAETKIGNETVSNNETSKYKISSLTTDNSGIITITNTHERETIDINVNKVWEDKDDIHHDRPQSINVHLFAGETEVATKKITSTDNWSHIFKGLPKNENGKEIEYSVTEDEIEGYETKIKGNETKGFTITNTKTYEYVVKTNSATTAQKPVNYILVVDTSSSMDGTRITQAISAMNTFLNTLFSNPNTNSSTKVNIIQFNKTAAKRTSTPLTKANYNTENVTLSTAKGTNIESGLVLAKDSISEEMINVVILLSDGAPNEGKRDKEELADIARELEAYNTKYDSDGNRINETTVYTIGFGSDANNPNKKAYKILQKISKDGIVYTSSNATELIQNLDDITLTPSPYTTTDGKDLIYSDNKPLTKFVITAKSTNGGEDINATYTVKSGTSKYGVFTYTEDNGTYSLNVDISEYLDYYEDIEVTYYIDKTTGSTDVTTYTIVSEQSSKSANNTNTLNSSLKTTKSIETNNVTNNEESKDSIEIEQKSNNSNNETNSLSSDSEDTQSVEKNVEADNDENITEKESNQEASIESTVEKENVDNTLSSELNGLD